jgi:signal peptidase II
LAVSAAALTILLDQITKRIVIDELGPGSDRGVVELLPGLRFIFVRNTGSAFGLFQGRGELLTILTFLAIGALAVYFYRNARRDPLLGLALGLLLGGAIGNLTDRIRYGYVVDFIDVWKWPTFNIADSAITVGVILLVYTLTFREPRPVGEQAYRSPADAGARQPIPGDDA